MLSPKKVALIAASLALLIALPGRASAQGLDPASAQALAETLRMLQDPTLRGAAIGKDPKAAAIDQQLRGMTGGSEPVMKEFYELAAEIFNDLTRSLGGDVRQMTQALERGQRDPAGFAAMLSPRTLQRLRELSTKMSDRPR